MKYTKEKNPTSPKATKGAGARASREKPTNLGAKVYKKHRVMLRKMAKWQKVSMNEVLRLAIELKFNHAVIARNIRGETGKGG